MRYELVNILKKKQKSHSLVALEKFTTLLPANSSIIDVGSGPQELHAKILRIDGHNVDTCDFHEDATYRGNFNKIKIPKQYDGVWSSHCLEHQLNVNAYLKKVASCCKEGGYICITVPPLKHTIVGGHVTLWNAGLLIYNTVLAGLDCTNAKIKTYGYNISIIVKKKSFIMPELHFVGTDLGLLKQYFPSDIRWRGNDIKPKFEGQLQELNW